MALPITQSPAVFGLHPNAEITYFSSSAKELWLGLISMQTGEGGKTDGVSREEFIIQGGDLDVCENIHRNRSHQSLCLIAKDVDSN